MFNNIFNPTEKIDKDSCRVTFIYNSVYWWDFLMLFPHAFLVLQWNDQAKYRIELIEYTTNGLGLKVGPQINFDDDLRRCRDLKKDAQVIIDRLLEINYQKARKEKIKSTTNQNKINKRIDKVKERLLQKIKAYLEKFPKPETYKPILENVIERLNISDLGILADDDFKSDTLVKNEKEFLQHIKKLINDSKNVQTTIFSSNRTDDFKDDEITEKNLRYLTNITYNDYLVIRYQLEGKIEKIKSTLEESNLSTLLLLKEHTRKNKIKVENELKSGRYQGEKECREKFKKYLTNFANNLDGIINKKINNSKQGGKTLIATQIIKILLDFEIHGNSPNARKIAIAKIRELTETQLINNKLKNYKMGFVSPKYFKNEFINELREQISKLKPHEKSILYNALDDFKFIGKYDTRPLFRWIFKNIFYLLYILFPFLKLPTFKENFAKLTQRMIYADLIKDISVDDQKDRFTTRFADSSQAKEYLQKKFISFRIADKDNKGNKGYVFSSKCNKKFREKVHQSCLEDINNRLNDYFNGTNKTEDNFFYFGPYCLAGFFLRIFRSIVNLLQGRLPKIEINNCHSYLNKKIKIAEKENGSLENKPKNNWFLNLLAIHSSRSRAGKIDNMSQIMFALSMGERENALSYMQTGKKNDDHASGLIRTYKQLFSNYSWFGLRWGLGFWGQRIGSRYGLQSFTDLQTIFNIDCNNERVSCKIGENKWSKQKQPLLTGDIIYGLLVDNWDLISAEMKKKDQSNIKALGVSLNKIFQTKYKLEDGSERTIGDRFNDFISDSYYMNTKIEKFLQPIQNSYKKLGGQQQVQKNTNV